METSNKEDTPKIELPNDVNKLFDEEDDVGNSTIPDLSLPSEDEKEEVNLNSVWEYAINDLVQLSPLHAEGKSLKLLVKFQSMDNMEQIYLWDEHDIIIGEPTYFIY